MEQIEHSIYRASQAVVCEMTGTRVASIRLKGKTSRIEWMETPMHPVAYLAGPVAVAACRLGAIDVNVPAKDEYLAAHAASLACNANEQAAAALIDRSAAAATEILREHRDTIKDVAGKLAASGFITGAEIRAALPIPKDVKDFE